jgi:chromosome segregation ATPase
MAYDFISQPSYKTHNTTNTTTTTTTTTNAKAKMKIITADSFDLVYVDSWDARETKTRKRRTEDALDAMGAEIDALRAEVRALATRIEAHDDEMKAVRAGSDGVQAGLYASRFELRGRKRQADKLARIDVHRRRLARKPNASKHAAR